MPGRAAGALLLTIVALAVGGNGVANAAGHDDDEDIELPAADGESVEDGPDPLTLYLTRSALSVYFPRGSAEITGPAMDTIADNARRLLAEARRRLLLVGYTDDFSGSDEGATLAERRAMAVKERLVDLGIPAQRIETGVNRENPEVVPCLTEICRLSYRRVRFSFVDARRATKEAGAKNGGPKAK